jgi:hypothetical protein
MHKGCWNSAQKPIQMRTPPSASDDDIACIFYKPATNSYQHVEMGKTEQRHVFSLNLANKHLQTSIGILSFLTKIIGVFFDKGRKKIIGICIYVLKMKPKL